MFLARFSALCILIIQITAVPPEECFANFRWDDCGKPPEPVMYYWKPGSRCEVGTWRGCVPNPNMFKNEYECVNTCIYNVNRNELRQKNLEKIMKPADSVELMESNIEKENVGLNETETTSLIDSGFSGTTVANEAKDSDATLASIVTLIPDEMSSSNATETLMASDQMLTSNVDGETLASNDSVVHDETTLASNDNLVPDKPSASNENLVANETTFSNNTFLADDTPASNVRPYVPNEPVGFNKTDVNEEEASKQEKNDNKTEEVDKPKGRSRLATYLKGK